MRTASNGTRLAGGLSLIALAAVTYSDLTFTRFWDHNAMATSMVADVLVLLVGVAVVNEWLAARSRRSWKLLADYALVDLAQTAALVWVHIAEAIGIGDRKEIGREQLRERIESSHTQGHSRELALATAGESSGRIELHRVITPLSDDTVAALARWAALLADTPHARPLTRYVRLQAELGTLELSLREEAKGLRPSFEGTAEPHWIAERLASLIVLGDEVERELMALVTRDRRDPSPTVPAARS